MSENVKIINAKTRQEAQMVFDDFTQERKRHNTVATIIIIALFIAWIAGMIAIDSFCAESWKAGVGFATTLIVGIFIYCALESYESTCSMLWPAVYKYHLILEDYNILKTEVHYCDGNHSVEFVVSNRDNEVSRKYLYGFQKVVKTDVDTVTIDIANERIYEPYVA